MRVSMTFVARIATVLVCCGPFVGCQFEAPPLPGPGPSATLDAGIPPGMTDAAGGNPDATPAPIDAGGNGGPDATTPDVGGPDATTPVDAGDPLDTGSATDATTVDPPDAELPEIGVPEAGVPDIGFPDAGFPDATIPDTGVPASRCNETFSSASVFGNLRAMLPANAGGIRSPWLSNNQRVLYASVESPLQGMPTRTGHDIYVFTRPTASSVFTRANRTNLDLLGMNANSSDDLDLTFVTATSRFWFTVVTSNRFAELNSAELMNPMQPQSFVGFANEVQRLPALEQNNDYRGPALSEDGLVLVSSIFDTTTMRWQLVEHTRTQVAGMWGAGRRPVVQGVTGDDLDAWLHADGNLLLWASNRGGNYDIYCSWRPTRAWTWSPAVRFGGRFVNTPESERSPFVTADGLLFSRPRGPGPEDIHLARP